MQHETNSDPAVAPSVVAPSAIDIRRLALECLVDERTFRKALVGRKIRPICRERIETTLRELGLGELLPPRAVDGR